MLRHEGTAVVVAHAVARKYGIPSTRMRPVKEAAAPTVAVMLKISRQGD
jgi:hypothetical protein